jgi:hypothetical protein
MLMALYGRQLRNKPEQQILVQTTKSQYRRAKGIIDAPNAAESFRREVRQAIKYGIKEGLETEEDKVRRAPGEHGR